MDPDWTHDEDELISKVDLASTQGAFNDPEQDEIVKLAFEFLMKFRHNTFAYGKEIQYIGPLKSGEAKFDNDLQRNVLEWASEQAGVRLGSRTEGARLEHRSSNAKRWVGGYTTYFVPTEDLPKFNEFRDSLLKLIVHEDNDVPRIK